jgi:parallel beta-helix repeat protein
LVIYTVTKVADNNLPGSLCYAINQANGDSKDINLIDFDFPTSGVHTIEPTSPLPLLKTHIEVRGTTDAAGNPLIQIDGQLAGPNSSGLIFDRSTPGDTSEAIVSGLIINRFALDGIDIAGSGEVEVFGCRIGTDPTGNVASGNGRDGIRIYSPDNFIGLPYSGPAYSNVFDGNGGNGISVFGGDAGSNVFQNNFVGLAADGYQALGNEGDGIWIDTAGSTIGGATSLAANIISGNHHLGIDSSTGTGPNSAGPNQIFGNKIGTDFAGTSAMPNYLGGIGISAGTGTQIGDAQVGTRNVISGNLFWGIGDSGVSISIENDYVGTDVTGTKALDNQTGILISSANSTVDSCVVSGNDGSGIQVVDASHVSIEQSEIGANAAKTGPIANGTGIEVNNTLDTLIENNTIAFNLRAGVYVEGDTSGATIEENSIYSNGGLGIQLGPSTSPLPNDPGDTDTGPNGLQNYAVLTSATTSSSGTTVKGTFNGKPNANRPGPGGTGVKSGPNQRHL